jgi:hypothetical protein
MKAWAIKKWNDTFEAAASRKLRTLTYIGLPVDQGSKRFRRLMQDEAGAAAHGHFMAIVQWAATLPCRGLLVRSGEPLTIEEIALYSHIPPPMLAKSWPLLTGPTGVEWIEEVEFKSLPQTPYWSAITPPRTRRTSASDPPLIRQESPGTPLALNTTTQRQPPKDNPQTGAAEPLGFADFWGLWPASSRKVNRHGCLKKWASMGLPEIMADVLVGLVRWKRSVDWAKDGGQYIPLPATWLTQRRWENHDLQLIDDGEPTTLEAAEAALRGAP